MTRLGNFWKFLLPKFLRKVTPTNGIILGYFVKSQLYVNSTLATFWENFGNIFATFYSYIWSHWTCVRSAKFARSFWGLKIILQRNTKINFAIKSRKILCWKFQHKIFSLKHQVSKMIISSWIDNAPSRRKMTQAE